MSDLLSPRTPDAKPAKRQRRRRRRSRRNGKKKQVQMQNAQHDEVVGRLDKICDLLQVAIEEIVDARSNRRDPRNTEAHGTDYSSRSGSPTPSASLPNKPVSGYPPYPHAVYPRCGCGCDTGIPCFGKAMSTAPTASPATSCSCSSCRTPSPAELVENSSTACPEAISKLADSFFFLEMELKVTRDRLRDLRAIVDTAPEENLRNAIRALADALEENIEQDLSRLFIINRQQLDIGLTDSVPYLNDGFERPQRRSVPVHCPPAPEPQSQDADTRAYERPDSDDSNGMAFQEWIRVCKEPDWGRVGDLRSPPSLASYGRYG